MKLTFSKQKLTNALSLLLLAVSNHSASLLTEGILIEAESGADSVTMSSYDLEKGVRLIVEAEVIEGGSYVINAQRFSQIVRSMPEEAVNIKVDEKKIVLITGGRSAFRLHAVDGSDFPSLPSLNGEEGFYIGADELKKLVSKVQFAVAVADSRPALNGIYFEVGGEQIRTVGCDGYKFAMCTKHCELKNAEHSEQKEFKFIVPGKTSSELIKILSDKNFEENANVLIELARKHIIFNIGTVTFFSRIIDHEYIDYRRVIPAESKITATINTYDVLSALERVSLVTEDRAAGSVKSYVKFSFKENKLELTSDSVNGSVRDEIGTFHDGDDIDIAFNCKYLMEAFRSCEDEEIVLGMNTPLMSMTIQPAAPDENDTFLFFVLPVRMKDQG